MVSPVGNHLGIYSVLVPIAGALIIGVMARYGSERIRGHGIPEAIESILLNGSRIEPKVALLKPISSAISIGSGGPFGAEGPIIMTGGAVGSMIAQLFHLTSAERKTLLVAGAAGGMSATFASPVAAVLLAVELLLFEWKPRSLIPVALASAMAAVVRRYILGFGPLFPVPAHPLFIGPEGLLGCALVGLLAGILSALLTISVYAAEDAFQHLKIHWMWWPAIGGVVVGLCGYIFPESLGVGYSVIQQLISGDAGWKLLAGILIIKSLSWAFSLGSNTAGGILAPLLMIGGALGAALGHLMPIMSTGAWVLVGMCAVLSAAIGAPLTSAMLALELTHNGGLMLPVLLSCVAAYAVSVLVMPRSMLTENLSRRGLHLSREFGADPLEGILVSQAMHTSVFALPENATRKDAADWLRKMGERGSEAWSHWQRIFPLVDSDGRMTGTLTRSQLIAAARKEDLTVPLAEDANRDPRTISPVTTLRTCAMSMAESKLTSYPVVSADGKLLGVMTISDLLKGRSEEAHRESDRERVLRLRWPFGPTNGTKSSVIHTAPITHVPSPEELDESD